MAALPGIITSPEIRYLLAGVLILTGLALAFWGHGLWATVMSMIGALLGAVVGYLFGAALGGDLAGLILAIVGAVIGDRKSTRLNSSHGYISYAVFCLKKKNNVGLREATFKLYRCFLLHHYGAPL